MYGIRRSYGTLISQAKCQPATEAWGYEYSSETVKKEEILPMNDKLTAGIRAPLRLIHNELRVYFT